MVHTPSCVEQYIHVKRYLYNYSTYVTADITSVSICGPQSGYERIQIDTGG